VTLDLLSLTEQSFFFRRIFSRIHISTPLPLLPAEAKVAERNSHLRKDSAFVRRKIR